MEGGTCCGVAGDSESCRGMMRMQVRVSVGWGGGGLAHNIVQGSTGVKQMRTMQTEVACVDGSSRVSLS
jgi:hypothetical protein